MAGFEYGGGGEDVSGGGVGGSGTRPFDTDGYMGFDSGLPSKRFDESQRFDESFRAPELFNPSFGDDPKEEVGDDFKGANGFGFHQAEENPPAYGFEDEPSGQPAEASRGYEASFEPDLHSEYGQGGGEYIPEHGSNGNGFGANGDDDTLFSSIPPSDGPILPPPEDMKEEGLALREWKRLNAIRLEEKERNEREMLAKIIEEADDFKDGQFAKRKTAIENGKKNNRDREKTYLANQENFHKDAHKHYWKAVAELIPNELPTIDKGGRKDKKDKKPGIVAIKGPKPGKSTDMTRLRHVLVKLKHNPPPHMKYKPPPPPPATDKDKEKDKDKAKDGKEKDAASPAAPESSAAPAAAAPAPAPTPLAAA